MSKKFNNKTLFIVLIALAAILVCTELFRKTDKNLKTDIASFKSEEISEITIKTKSSEEPIKITKKGDNDWQVAEGDKIYKAGTDIVESYLSELQKIKSQRLAARSKDKWAEYQLTDTSATRIKLYNSKNKMLLDLLIGKFTYKQVQNPYGRNNVQGTSYVRLANEKEIYAVDGFLSMSLNRNFDDWRNRTLTKLKKDDVKKISFTYPDSSFTLELKDTVWYAGNKMVDTKKVESYLASLQNKKGYKFNNDFQAVSNPMYQVKIEGDNLTDIEVKAYQTQDNKLAIQSSQNTEAFFESDKAGLFKQIFKSINDF